MQRIRKGDEVIVIAGKDKGKKGIVSARIDDRVSPSKVSMLPARLFVPIR
mgnify:CR=1 FL=1